MREPGVVVTRFLRPSLAALAALALTAACANQPGPVGQGGATTTSTPAATRAAPADPSQPVTVALLAPTSAADERTRAVAQDLVAAAQMARRDASDPNIRLKIYDTGGQAGQAADVASRAIQGGAKLILGPLFGASTQAVGPVAARSGVNVISFSSDASVAGDNVWVLGDLPRNELDRILGYAGSQGIGSVALVRPQNRYGELIAREIERAARRHGVGVASRVSYPRSFTGIETATQSGAARIRGSGASGVLIADSGDALRSAASFLDYYDVSPRDFRYLGLSRWNDPRNASESSLQGGWFAGPDPNREAAFEQRFVSAIGRQPVALADIAYDAMAAVGALLDSARRSGRAPFSSAAITDPRGFRGAGGSFRFTDGGRNVRSLAVMRITPDGLEVIDPAPTAAPGV